MLKKETKRKKRRLGMKEDRENGFKGNGEWLGVRKYEREKGSEGKGKNKKWNAQRIEVLGEEENEKEKTVARTCKEE